MKPLRYLALGLVISSFFGCQTAPTHSQYASQTQGTAYKTRSIAAADGDLITQFIDELASKSSLESRDAFDQVFIKMANSDGARDIKSMDDLRSLSEADQKKLISEVLNNPSLEKELAVSLDAAKQARINALNFSEVHAVRTTDVPDLKKPTGTTADGGGSGATNGFFSDFIRANPAARADIQEMLSESNDVQAKTGMPLLNKDCGSVTNAEAMENLELIVDGVDHDVQAGTVKTAQEVPPAVEREMGFVTGASKDEARSRVRSLSDPKGCAIFSPGIGGF